MVTPTPIVLQHHAQLLTARHQVTQAFHSTRKHRVGTEYLTRLALGSQAHHQYTLNHHAAALEMTSTAANQKVPTESLLLGHDA